MFDQSEQEQIGTEQVFAQDTLLTEDVYEHLQRRKIARLEIIAKTTKVGDVFLSLSLKCTGAAIARMLLLAGGSTNLWLACAICFGISSASGAAKLSGFNANYGANGLEISSGEKVFGGLISIGSSGAVTFLAVKDFMYYQGVSTATVEGIKSDINTLEQPSIWDTPFALGFGVILLVIGCLSLFGFGKKQQQQH
jgi:hypothetical protein